VIPPIDP
jgi:hypothetical protein